MHENNEIKFETRSDTEAMASSIIKIKEIFDEEGLFFWLNYGGLLGIIRDGKLLPWNNDLEVCCWYKDLNNDQIIKIVDHLNQLGFICIYYKSFGTINIKKGDLIDININFFWVKANKAIRPHAPASKDKKNFLAYILYWLSASMYIYPNTFKRFRFNEVNGQCSLKNIAKFSVAWISNMLPSKIKKTIFKFLIYLSKNFGGKFQQTAMPLSLYQAFKSYPFYHSSMYIPSDSEKVLEFLYGKGWRVPQDKWSFYDEKNKSSTSIEFIDEQFDYDHLEQD